MQCRQGFQRKRILLARNCEPCKLLTSPYNFAQFREIPHNCAQFKNSCAQFRTVARNGIATRNPIWDILNNFLNKKFSRYQKTKIFFLVYLYIFIIV